MSYKPGELIAGQWETVGLEPLGEGHFGEVHRVRRLHSSGLASQSGALKIQKGTDDRVAAQFAAEIELLAHLESLPTTHLIDSGVTEDGRRWFVMNLLDGRPLAKVQDGKLIANFRLPFSDSDWIEMARDLLSLLTELNDKGIAHRDIWPTNVMRLANGHWTIIDFGLARTIFDQRALEVNQRYRAPELHELNGDHKSDLFSTGLVLAYALVGGEVREQWEQNFNLHSLPRIAGNWADFLEGFLADDPHDRPDASELLAELEARASGEVQLAPGNRIRTWFELENAMFTSVADDSKKIRVEKPNGVSCSIRIDRRSGNLVISEIMPTLGGLGPNERSELMRAGFSINLTLDSAESRTRYVPGSTSSPQLIRALKAIGVRLAGSRVLASG